MPIGDELTEFQNAASVLTIDQLLRAFDSAYTALARVTVDGPIGALSADEIQLISIYRAIDGHGQRMVTIAAEAAAEIYVRTTDKRAEVIELHPRK